MDKLNALKYFCTAADTLQFRETAQRLSVSPQVVTRVIAELEDYLGEALFVGECLYMHYLAEKKTARNFAKERATARGVGVSRGAEWCS